MSFDPPFTTKYTKGDLFYGFSPPRAALMRFLGADPAQRGIDDLSVVNNYLITGEEKQSMASKLDTAGDRHLEQTESNIYGKIFGFMGLRNFRDKQAVKDELRPFLDAGIARGEALHRQQLQKPHQRFEETLQTYKGGKYAGAIGYEFDAGSDKVSETARQNAAWRKKCKGGLYYCIFGLKKTVHFCLGATDKVNDKFVELNHHQVATKTDPFDVAAAPATNVLKLRVITPAELRWIYRNRDLPEVRARVQFWRPAGDSWEACGAPWDTGPLDVRNSWSSYKPKSSLVHEKTGD